MSESEYYELPYGVGDRLELQNFLIADLYESIAKSNVNNNEEYPSSIDIINSWIFQLTH